MSDKNNGHETEVTPPPFVTAGGEIDTKALSAKLKERVDYKMSQGLYDNSEIDSFREMKLSSSEAARDFTLLFDSVEEREALLAKLDNGWDVTRPIDTSSPRPGIKGALISLYKSIYNKLVRPALNSSMAPQAEYNATVTHAFNNVRHALEQTEQMMNNLGAQQAGINRLFERYEKRLDALESSSEKVATKIASLEAAVSDIDRQGIFMRRRVSNLLDQLSNDGSLSSDTVKEEKDKLESLDYLLFENLHRGSREDIRQKLSVYPEWLKDAPGPIVDIGCGRGELLTLFNDAGLNASGVDINEEMVVECVDSGLAAEKGDAISYLGEVENGSLGGVTAIQVIEHLPTDVMVEFFRLAYEKLSSGGVLACETVNPTCLTTFCGAFYLDPTHDKPIHPLTVQFLLQRAGFSDVRIEYLNPYPEEMRLNRLPDEATDNLPDGVAEEFNKMTDRLNSILFSHTDYAVIAIK